MDNILALTETEFFKKLRKGLHDEDLHVDLRDFMIHIHEVTLPENSNRAIILDALVIADIEFRILINQKEKEKVNADVITIIKAAQDFLLHKLEECKKHHLNLVMTPIVLFGSFMGTESPLTVTQMLWVNLIMDTFGAMALASLPPSRSVMDEKPRRREASILTRPMMSELIGVGVLFFAITLGFYWLFNHAEVTSIPQMFHAAVGAENPMTPYEATLLFSIFVWTHFWYMFNARSFETGESVFKLKMSQGFWTIVGIIVIGQLFITEIAYEFFNVEPMLHTLDWSFNPSGALDLLIIVAASSLVLWVREIYRLFKK